MAERHLTMLAVDDDAGDVALLRRCLERVPRLDASLVHVRDSESARSALEAPDLDVVFLDYLLDGETSASLLSAMRAADDTRAVIILTGNGDESTAAELLRGGADDYVCKHGLDPSTLRRAIDNALAQSARRVCEFKNRALLADVQIAKAALEQRNQHLLEMYNEAHQFVDHVSHEFRTPLTVIREFASIVSDGLAGEVNGEQEEYLQIIVRHVDDLSTLVDDMLDLSRLEAGLLGINRRDCTANEIVDRVAGTLEQRATASRVALHIDLPRGVPTLFCDPEKVCRVIINLVINGLKFTQALGQVRLSVAHDPDRHEARWAVTDNGPGIAPDALKTLFDRFRQVAGTARIHLDGFGLGLGIAKELVQLNLGDICVSSERNSGSEFSFTVPVAERRPLIARYVERVGSFKPGLAHLWMIRIAAAGSAGASLLGELAQVIQRCVRPCDLLLPMAPGRWGLLAPTIADNVEPIVSRIRLTHSEANRNRPVGALPLLDVLVECSWRLPDKRIVPELDKALESWERVGVA